jgi:hypothetical protein
MPCATKERQAESARKHYEKNKVEMKQRARLNTIKQREALRGHLDEWKKQGCQAKGCVESLACCMQAHHLDPATKRFNVGSSIQKGYSLTSLIDELAKCVCLCANCHFKLHDGINIQFK